MCKSKFTEDYLYFSVQWKHRWSELLLLPHLFTPCWTWSEKCNLKDIAFPDVGENVIKAGGTVCRCCAAETDRGTNVREHVFLFSPLDQHRQIDLHAGISCPWNIWFSMYTHLAARTPQSWFWDESDQPRSRCFYTHHQWNIWTHLIFWFFFIFWLLMVQPRW